MAERSVQGTGGLILPKDCPSQITLRKPREAQDVVKEDGPLQASNPASQDKDTHSSISESKHDAEKVTSSIKQHQLSVDACEFVPKSQSVYVPCDNEENYGYEIADYLNGILAELTANPGYYDYITEDLISTINQLESINDQQVSSIIDCILEQAVYEPNFHYNGARLCNKLSRNLQVNGSSFRTMLLKNCRDIHEQRHEIITNNPEYFQGFALFMSELFLNLTIGSETSFDRIQVLGDAIIEIVETLLSHASLTNIKCLCQVLKLTGAVIEDHEKGLNGTSSKMDKLITNIHEAILSNDLPSNAREMLQKIVQLHANDWGRANDTHSIDQSSHIYEEEGIAYGPDGPIFTEEEAAFLETNAADTCDDGSIWDYDAGLDDEMAEAFEEFLKIQNKTSKKPNI